MPILAISIRVQPEYQAMIDAAFAEYAEEFPASDAAWQAQIRENIKALARGAVYEVSTDGGVTWVAV